MKNVEIAVLLSVFIPGMGNFYLKKHRGTGIAYMIAVLLLLYMASGLQIIYFVYGLLVLTAVIDSVLIARKFNYKLQKDISINSRPGPAK